MLLAYIDEIGEPGAFVSKDHPRYKTSPVFGYAGFVIDEEKSRGFGQTFTHEKRKMFKTQIEEAAHSGRWEAKGADLFRPATPSKYPQYLRLIRGLVNSLSEYGGKLFYYVDEKPIGTPGQTRKYPPEDRERGALFESINRLCSYADNEGKQLMVMVDQINEKTRSARVAESYAHVFSRSAARPEMKRLVEPPMHIDSHLSANIQFADWVAAALTRAIDRQLIEHSDFMWVPAWWTKAFSGNFTYESKVHLWHRSIQDLHHAAIVGHERLLYPTSSGQRIGASMPAEALRKLRAASERAHL